MSGKEESTVKVADQPQRRQFTPEYKLRILQEIDARRDEGRGVVGEILRREGIYASQVASWRNSLEEVIANGLPEKKRGRKQDPALAYKKKAEKLERDLAKANEKLRQARLIIEAQKKIAAMFNEEQETPEEPS